ncbi:hypothetical protein GKD14_11900 [Paeniclostridium sordellii]|nr:hypothetical protein [Paeniclostridium sordellii]MSB59646.1 hypothetical protein [Paeniclostridium sordellii]
MYVKKQIYSSDLEKVERYIEHLRNKHSELNKLLIQLSDIGENILVGGAIRDIILKESKPRDLDFIINTNKDLDIVLGDEFKYVKNRFGGYKINIESIELDIWSINDHWAFKEKIIEKDENNLRYTTFLNFDAIFYMLDKKSVDSYMFNSCIKKECLDITLDEEFIYLNPSKDINVLRMLNIVDEWGLKLSNKSYIYIKKWIVDNKDDTIERLYRAQIKHYKYEKLNRDKIYRIIKNIELYRLFN